MTPSLMERLEWQLAVNRALIAAGYKYGRSLLGPADFARMDAAFVAGESPDTFAHAVIMKNEHEVAA